MAINLTAIVTLVLPQTQKIAGRAISGLEKKKIVYTTKLSGFKSFRTQSSHFKFWIQNLRIHGQTGKYLKRSGFVTNPEQLPLVSGLLFEYRFASSRLRLPIQTSEPAKIRDVLKPETKKRNGRNETTETTETSKNK